MAALAPLDRLPAFDREGRLRVVIEASAATRTKLKYEPRLRAFELHLMLPVGSAFPTDFGFIPSTRGGDGDPLDALVFADEPLAPGIVVPCHVLGVIEAEQTSAANAKPVRNDRFIAVAAASHRFGHWRSLEDVPGKVLCELEAFFVSYNAQRGVKFTPLGRKDAAAARRALKRSAGAGSSRRKR
ncbi:MAG TPA: inorganic diphosphatase [Ramlibacter sp.]|uniref:inorganic diphosphatase n=1 Tax=Ramlibacter sp. TaxID=1917967 RepID=UPI002B9DF1AE|nr:inorganic diphosphatase [Ramlibacter sp.]HVZ45717.1 inorganic diphosphatase [Ramlibacter sp.]